MNPPAVLRFLSLLVKVCSILLGFSAYAHFIPGKYAPIAGLIFAAASIVKDAANRFEDQLTKFPLTAKVIALLCFLGASLCAAGALTSCANSAADRDFRSKVSAVKMNTSASYDPSSKITTGFVNGELDFRDPGVVSDSAPSLR